MPVVIRSIALSIQGNDAAGTNRVRLLEEKQFHAQSCTRIQAEIHAAGAKGGAERDALPDSRSGRRFRLRDSVRSSCCCGFLDNMQAASPVLQHSFVPP